MEEPSDEVKRDTEWAMALLDSVMRPLKPRKRSTVVKIAIAIKNSTVLRQAFATALQDEPTKAEALINVTVGLLSHFAEGEGTMMRTMTVTTLLAAGKEADGQWPGSLGMALVEHWGEQARAEKQGR